MQVKITDGQVAKFPYSVGQLRKDNPNVSFPKTPSAEVLANWGVYNVTPAAHPDFDRATQDVKRVNPTLVNGEWTEAWEVVTVSAEEQATRRTSQEQTVRSKRDQKLAESDWTQVADAPVDKAAWATYRQVLRDVPLQAGFPWNVSWPTQP